MAKRISEEERVTQYFSTAPMSELGVVFNIVVGIVKNRRLSGVDVPVTKKPVVKRKRRSKAEIAAAQVAVN